MAVNLYEVFERALKETGSIEKAIGLTKQVMEFINSLPPPEAPPSPPEPEPVPVPPPPPAPAPAVAQSLEDAIDYLLQENPKGKSKPKVVVSPFSQPHPKVQQALDLNPPVELDADGNPKRRRHRMGFTDAERNMISQLYKQGLRIEEIANRMDRNDRSIRQLIARDGVPGVKVDNWRRTAGLKGQQTRLKNLAARAAPSDPYANLMAEAVEVVLDKKLVCGTCHDFVAYSWSGSNNPVECYECWKNRNQKLLPE